MARAAAWLEGTCCKDPRKPKSVEIKKYDSAVHRSRSRMLLGKLQPALQLQKEEG